MSDMYAIKTSTLTALGDAVRSKVGETRPGMVDVPIQCEVVNIPYAISTVSVDLSHDTNKNVKSIKFCLTNGDKSLLRRSSVYYTGTSHEFTFDENNEYLYTFGDDYKHTGANLQVMATEPTTIELEITYYDADGYIVREEAMVKNTMTPLEMAEEINALAPTPTNEELTITGDCGYRFIYGGWDWFIKKYGDSMTTKDLTNTGQMFFQCQRF